MKAKKVILQFICPDKAGVLSSATQFLFKRNAFMTEVSSFSDHDTKKFLSRIAFEKEDKSNFDLEELDKNFSEELQKFDIDPAIATGPFVTTSIDILGVTLYFLIASVVSGVA